jgi:hypothetical protein
MFRYGAKILRHRPKPVVARVCIELPVLNLNWGKIDSLSLHQHILLFRQSGITGYWMVGHCNGNGFVHAYR